MTTLPLTQAPRKFYLRGFQRTKLHLAKSWEAGFNDLKCGQSEFESEYCHFIYYLTLGMLLKLPGPYISHLHIYSLNQIIVQILPATLSPWPIAEAQQLLL